MSQTIRRAIWAFTAALAVSSTALADIYNRQAIPLGESEAFLGNTGTGRANDTGAVYYNPAGLAGVRDAQFSVSGSVYLSQSSHMDSLVQVGDKPVPVDASEFDTIPSTYVVAYPLGSWHFAFSVLVPDQSQSENVGGINLAGAALNYVTAYRLADLWLGPSMATRISEHWSLGMTLYGMSHTESTVSGASAYNSAGAGNTATSLRRSQLTAIGLSFILGVLYEPEDWLSLGLRIQSPFIQVSGKANLFNSSLQTAGGTVTPATDKQDGVPATYNLPMDFTLGSAFRLVRELQLLFDVSVQLPAHYQSIAGDPTSSSYNTLATPRGNLGIEYLATEKLIFRTGLFYNPSSLHDLGGQPEGTSRSDITGFSLGVCWHALHVQTGLGLVAYWGSGQNLPVNSGGTPASVSMNGLGGLLTTAYVF